jgi:YVTN family beta-propeller protein
LAFIGLQLGFCRKSNCYGFIFWVRLSNIIHVGLNPLSLEISPDGRWCYVPNRNSNSVSVIDVQTMTVVKTIAEVGIQPHTIDFTADGHYAYVSCESQSGSFVHHPSTGSNKPGTTAVIDVWNGHIKIRDIEMASFPAGMSITPGRGN